MAVRINPTTSKRSGVSRASNPRVSIPQWRIMALLLVCLLIIVRVLLRLLDLQVIRSPALADAASREISQQVTLHPSRGIITDRHGNILAVDVERESLWVVPSQIPADKAARLAFTLAPLIGKSETEILEALTTEDLYWLPVARWLEPTVAEQIASLQEPGLRLIYEPQRIYPQGSFAAQVIGSTNHNGDGNSGVESFYNTSLKGITGTLTAEFDAVRNPIAIAPQERQPPRDGVNLKLTIDPLVQNVIEAELKLAVEAHNADGGSIVVIEPSTGAVRGMASWPPFDPNRYYDYPPEVFARNPAVSDLYEPGSTFKMITVAAGLQTGAFTADTQVYDSGVVERYGEVLHNWNSSGNGMIDPAGMLYYSSNVGALQLNELTGVERFYQMVYAFGFGAPTGIDLGGEEQGIVHDGSSPFYNDFMLLTNAYGQGISVTPLQMVSAAATIANEGVRMQPYIVEERCEGDECVQTQPVELGQVLDPGVAWTVRRMLVNSANGYAPVVWAAQTGNWGDQWLVPGYQVGAKTGTSSIPIPGGGYDPSYTIGSVLGFAPADEARYAVLVKIDRPKDDIWGVGTAIPVYYKVVERLMRYARVPPEPGLYSSGQ